MKIQVELEVDLTTNSKDLPDFLLDLKNEIHDVINYFGLIKVDKVTIKTIE